VDDSCDERKASANREVLQALGDSNSCETSADCTLSGRDQLWDCEFNQCAVAVNAAEVARFDSRIDEINSAHCGSFQADCESTGGSVCGEQHDSARCEEGRCVPVPCAERIAAAITEILSEHDARACGSDDECTMPSEELYRALTPVADYCSLAVSTTVDQEALTEEVQSLPVEPDCYLGQACPAVPCAGVVFPRCVDGICALVQDPCP
jgi:hypothetical protein